MGQSISETRTCISSCQLMHITPKDIALPIKRLLAWGSHTITQFELHTMPKLCSWLTPQQLHFQSSSRHDCYTAHQHSDEKPTKEQKQHNSVTKKNTTAIFSKHHSCLTPDIMGTSVAQELHSPLQSDCLFIRTVQLLAHSYSKLFVRKKLAHSESLKFCQVLCNIDKDGIPNTLLDWLPIIGFNTNFHAGGNWRMPLMAKRRINQGWIEKKLYTTHVQQNAI